MLEKTKWYNLLKYLDDQLSSKEITWQTYALGVRIAFLFEDYIGLPNACVGPNDEDNVLFYSWDSTDVSRENHFEIEIQPCGLIEVFYRNRISEETYYNEYYKVEDLMTNEVMSYAKKIKSGKATGGNV